MPSVVLMGSKPASVVALSVFLARGWDVRYVVASENVDLSWYGGESLKELALRHGVTVMTKQSELPTDTKVDFVISYMFRNLVRPYVLAMAKRTSLNFHAAPLPAYGGWAFYNAAILENVTNYGVTCHHMDESFDTGPILKVKYFTIDPRLETAHSLEARAQFEMIQLFVDVCALAESGRELPVVPQDPQAMRYFNRAQLEALKQIPAGADAESVDRVARAFWYPPYECAYGFLNGTKVEVIPEAAKLHTARMLHRDDLSRLRMAVEDYKPSLEGF